MNKINLLSEDYFLTTLNDLKARVQSIEKILDSRISQNSNKVCPEFNSIEEIKTKLREGVWELNPQREINHGWDKLVDSWIEIIPTIGEKIPSAYRIWQSSNRYYKAGMFDRADRCERLNYLFHNSYIPASLELEGEITFAYGGIRVILHKDAQIAPYVTVGANVTIGGNGSKTRFDNRSNKVTTVPKIGAMTVIGAGANITGGIEVGPLVIIAPNSVVTKSVSAGAIMAGVPAKEIGKVTVANALHYKAKFLPARTWSEEEYINFVKENL